MEKMLCRTSLVIDGEGTDIKINNWTVIGECGRNKRGKLYLCRCKCGKTTKKNFSSIKESKGCFQCARENKSVYVYSTGQKIGDWTILRKTNLAGNIYTCECKCGNISNIAARNIAKKKSTRCGSCARSARNYVHGMARTRVYRIWAGMRQRCNNPKNNSYKWYGGRGIRVSERWDDFTSFLEDMGNPKKNLVLDRINPNKNYSKENCRWITNAENARRMNTDYKLINKDKLKMLCGKCLQILDLNLIDLD